MAIEITNPIVIPPQAEKVADRVWVCTMNVNANAGNTAPTTAYFSVAPFISSTGEILKDKIEHINVNDVFAACMTNPTLAQAVGAIYLAVESLCKEKGLFGMEPDPIIPSIITNPSGATIDINNNIALSVKATGRPLNYQWKKDGLVLTDGGNISGANTSILSIGLVTESNAGTYNVVVSNILGEITSTDAVLTVTIPQIIALPSITTNPIDLSVDINNSATFSVTAEGESLNYQWRKDGINLVDGDNISGSTTSLLTINSATDMDIGIYNVVVGNGAGEITSIDAILSVTIPEVVNP